MTMNPCREMDIIPIAGRLVTAVARRDAEIVAKYLNDPDLDWRALVVVLADNTGRIREPLLLAELTYEMKIERKAKKKKMRARVSCAGCGVPTRTISGTCKACRDVHDSPKVLVGGDWVARPGGVRVWQEAS